MRVLITGAAGFIGSNLYNRCLEIGWNVLGVDDMSNGRSEFLSDKSKMFVSDFAAPEILDAIRNREFDVIFHTASTSNPQHSLQNESQSNECNVIKSIKLIEACKGNIKKFVFSSSSAVYGETSSGIISEDTEKNINSPYGFQKLIIENYLKMWYKLYGLDSISLRYFDVYGRNQLGNSRHNSQISEWLDAVFMGEINIKSPNRIQIMDFCHVDDIVNANIQSAIKIGHSRGEAVNVASGSPITIEKLQLLFKSKFNNLCFDENEKKSRPYSIVDISNSKRLIAFEPKINIQIGLNDTISWYKKIFNG
jgi:nucleoside-diphosphate-sugar epimerase